MKAYLCFVLFLAYQQSGLVSALVEHCYFCNTEVHGQSCEEPINPNGIQIQNCPKSDIVTNQYYSSNKNVIQGPEVAKDSLSTRNYGNVCINMTYVFNSRNVSARGCEIEFIDTNIGTLDICEYYRQIIPARISNFQCASCTAELCNHAGFVEEEEVEEEEVEEEVEDEPIEEDEEENAPVEEEEVEGGDGANVFTLSLSLLVAVVGVRLAVI